MLTLKVKIKIDQLQEIKINTLSNEHRLLYNNLLDNIKDKALTFKELNELYKQYRHTNSLTINSKSAQNTCLRLTNNIKSYYELKKKDNTVKFPYHFKSYKYFFSFTYDYNNAQGGFTIKDNILTINLLSSAYNAKKLVIELPKICNKLNENNIKTLTFSKDERGYFISFVYAEEQSNTKLNKNNFLSIDLGYSQLVTCYSNNITNFSIENLKHKKDENKIRYLQSLKDKRKKNSKKYKKINKNYIKSKHKQSNKIIDFQHKVSHYIIDKCITNNIGSLIVGDLKVKKILCKKDYKISGISKSTGAIGRFKTFLEYKSKNANMDFYKPNEAYTSQQNCLTGEIMFSSDLDRRTVEVKPGLVIDRDLNSAINIAKKIKDVWHVHDLDFGLDRMYFNQSSDSLIKI